MYPPVSSHSSTRESGAVDGIEVARRSNELVLLDRNVFAKSANTSGRLGVTQETETRATKLVALVLCIWKICLRACWIRFPPTSRHEQNESVRVAFCGFGQVARDDDTCAVAAERAVLVDQAWVGTLHRPLVTAIEAGGEDLRGGKGQRGKMRGVKAWQRNEP